VTLQSPRPGWASHVGGCLGFWLWALVGIGVTLGFVSFFWFAIPPALLLAYLISRRPRWNDGPPLLGLIAGAGLCFLLIAAINWSGWHHRTPGNDYPNPYTWGGAGLVLIATAVIAYAVRRERTS
jgi:hypothetical protein